MKNYYFVWTYPAGDSVKLFCGTMRDCVAWIDQQPPKGVQTEFERVMMYHIQQW